MSASASEDRRPGAPAGEALAWSEALALGHAEMDATHREFVDALGAARMGLAVGVSDAALASFEELLAHCVAHFGQEDRWMAATGFAPENCHARTHDTVLQLMREVLRVAREAAHWEPMRVLVGELGPWFMLHAQTMDAGLAEHLRAVGFDAVAGTAAGPLPTAPLTQCGSAGCR